MAARSMPAALHHGLTVPAGAATLLKGGWLAGPLHVYPSEMAQNFWTTICAWVARFTTTILISLLTRRGKTEDELRGLFWSLTPRVREPGTRWYNEPAALGAGILAAGASLYLIFW